MLVLEHLDWARSIAAAVARKLPTWFCEDDLIGPAEIGLVQAAERYDAGSGVPFRAYARQRVYGACMDSVRRREYRERGHASLESIAGTVACHDEQQSPERLAQNIEQMAVWEHVWRLPPVHRAVIQRAYGDGLTLLEIASVSSVSEARVSAIHREALDMLRVACEGMEP